MLTEVGLSSAAAAVVVATLFLCAPASLHGSSALVLLPPQSRYSARAAAPWTATLSAESAVRPVVGRGFWRGVFSFPAAVSGQCSLAATDEDDEDMVTTFTYPALSREEIEKFLANIPVYAVTSREQDGDIVLLSEPGNPNSVAYFFFSAETANEAFRNLKAQQKEGTDWDITRFSLGLVWFELLNHVGGAEGGGASNRRSVLDGVEYRLVPDENELTGARTLLSQNAQAVAVQEGKSAEEAEVPSAFQAAYNEVPLFIDQMLRIQVDGEERYPVYIGLQDLVATCQAAMGEDGESEYSAMIVVVDLHDLVRQMGSESEVNFREAVLFAPSPASQKQQAPPPQQAGAEESGDAVEPSYPETVINMDWSD